MKRYENECYLCASPGYPCPPGGCSRRAVLHAYCDECGREDEEMYTYADREYCKKHLLKVLLSKGIIEQVEFAL